MFPSSEPDKELERLMVLQRDYDAVELKQFILDSIHLKFKKQPFDPRDDPMATIKAFIMIDNSDSFTIRKN